MSSGLGLNLKPNFQKGELGRIAISRGGGGGGGGRARKDEEIFFYEEGLIP